MDKSDKTIQVVMMGLSQKLIKLQDKFEMEINSNRPVGKREKKVVKILGKIIDVETKINRFQQIINENKQTEQ